MTTARVSLDAGTRYGIALVGVLFAGYLNIATGFTTFLQAVDFGGTLGSDDSIVNAVQFVTILGLYVAAFTIAPASGSRRLAAVTLACVVLLLWATFGIERSIGTITEPVDLWLFVLNQGFITLVVSLGGWLLVRERHPLTFVVLVVAVVPPIVAAALRDASVTSGAYQLIIEAIVVLGGIGGAWAAWAIDRAVRSRRADRRA
jgi:hypothetical protein